MKKTLQRYLTDTHSKEYYVFNDLLAIATVVSIVSVVLETVPSLADYAVWFWIIEWTTVFLFTLEYGARLYVAKPAWGYVFSLYGLVDLLAIVPTYAGLGNLTFLKSARTLRLIRLLRMIRLAKIRPHRGHDVDQKMSFFVVNILLFVTVLVGALILVGTLIYMVEGDREIFASIPLGMLWAFKVFLAPFPVEYPVTTGGSVVHMLGRLVGLTVFGVLVGVIANVIKNTLFRDKA